MIDIASLVALCQAVLASGSKFIEAYKKKKLSGAEKELLIAAAQKGTFHIIYVDQGTWIRAGDQDFPASETIDSALAAEYLEAFKNLCGRGHIGYESGALFKLTVAGFKKARELAA